MAFSGKEIDDLVKKAITVLCSGKEQIRNALAMTINCCHEGLLQREKVTRLQEGIDQIHATLKKAIKDQEQSAAPVAKSKQAQLSIVKKEANHA